jgi:hypothetical protein
VWIISSASPSNDSDSRSNILSSGGAGIAIQFSNYSSSTPLSIRNEGSSLLLDTSSTRRNIYQVISCKYRYDNEKKFL